jgi:putative toxin-antitoxin system antitoxin component (TIGR02293 family)
VTAEKITIEDLRATVMREAIAFFEGDRVAAEKWLASPVRGLGNRAPMALMDSMQEIQKIRDVIGRLEHGVFT